MAATWIQFAREVLPAVPGCSPLIAENAIRSAVIDLCQKARVWRETLAAINVVQDQAAYVLTPSAGSRIISSVNVTYNEESIEADTEEDMDYVYGDWRLLPTGTPTKYLFMSPETLTLNKKPAAAITGGLIVRVTVKPTVDATDCDDLIRDDWLDVVADGAKAKLMAIPGQPWSNLAEARYLKKEFRKGVARARIRMIHGRTDKPLSARPVSF